MCASQVQSQPLAMSVYRQTVIIVAGTLDRQTLPDLERTVSANLDVGTSALVLDMLGVSVFDGVGLDRLQRVQSVCREQSVSLRVVPSDVVRRVLASHEAEHTFTLAGTPYQ